MRLFVVSAAGATLLASAAVHGSELPKPQGASRILHGDVDRVEAEPSSVGENRGCEPSTLQHCRDGTESQSGDGSDRVF